MTVSYVVLSTVVSYSIYGTHMLFEYQYCNIAFKVIMVEYYCSQSSQLCFYRIFHSIMYCCVRVNMHDYYDSREVPDIDIYLLWAQSLFGVGSIDNELLTGGKYILDVVSIPTPTVSSAAPWSPTHRPVVRVVVRGAPSDRFIPRWTLPTWRRNGTVLMWLQRSGGVTPVTALSIGCPMSCSCESLDCSQHWSWCCTSRLSVGGFGRCVGSRWLSTSMPR